MLMFPMIIMYEVSTGAYQQTLGPGRGPPGKKMKMNPAGQARSGQVMSYSASCCMLHALFVCSLSYKSLLPYTGSALYTLVSGRYDATYVLCTPYSSAYACMCA